MIHESSYWKDDLLKKAKEMRRRTRQRRWPEISFARLEQTIMLGFYGVRKLQEASKLSDATINQQISLSSYKWLGKKAVTLMNWDKIDHHYDLENPTSETRDVLFLCHQIVHSYVFLPMLNENNALSAIMFASDRQRHVSLLCLAVETIIALFEQVGKDYPASTHYHFNAKRQDYDIVSS